MRHRLGDDLRIAAPDERSKHLVANRCTPQRRRGPAFGLRKPIDEHLFDATLLALRQRPEHQSANSSGKRLDRPTCRKRPGGTRQQDLASTTIRVGRGLDGRQEAFTGSLELVDASRTFE